MHRDGLRLTFWMNAMFPLDERTYKKLMRLIEQAGNPSEVPDSPPWSATSTADSWHTARSPLYSGDFEDPSNGERLCQRKWHHAITEYTLPPTCVPTPDRKRHTSMTHHISAIPPPRAIKRAFLTNIKVLTATRGQTKPRLRSSLCIPRPWQVNQTRWYSSYAQSPSILRSPVFARSPMRVACIKVT